jgi:Zn-dependent metalloprotease
MHRHPLLLIVAALILTGASFVARPDAQTNGAVAAALAHFTQNRGLYGLANPAQELRARATRADDRGTRHVRFGQYYSGIPVFEGEAIAHVAADGAVAVTNGIKANLQVATAARVAQAAAVRTALAEIRPIGAPEIRDASLWILPRGERSLVDRLVWHVAVAIESATEEPAEWQYFVDAITGDVALAFNGLETGAAPGTARTMYIGNQTITVDNTGSEFLLRDPGRGNGNYTCDANNRFIALRCTPISRPTAVFGDNQMQNTDRATAGADAHYGLSATWDFLATLGRNGIDGAGSRTHSRVHYRQGYQNAFWNDACFCMTYGDGGPTLFPLVSLDITAHEVAHGVMSSEANLTYAGESGGLNESSSDIFGTLVEFFANSAVDVPDYWLAERIYKSNWLGGTYTQVKALRYLDDPAKDGTSPACWYSGLGNIDVHYSSGPNNHMFYLLAEGGVSKCNGNVVTGIGRSTAGAIWYRAIRDYMTAGTNYHGARQAMLDAAVSLGYAVGSPVYNSVNAAYAAIEVN